MGIIYDTDLIEDTEEEILELNHNKKIANMLLQYLESPNYSSEEKVEIILELLYRKKYDKEDYQNYSLATLKNSINIEFEEKDTVPRTQSCADMFAIFREDNSFIIAYERWQHIKRYKYKYLLYDATTDSLLYTYTYNKKEETTNDLPWRNGSIIKINGIRSYIVPISLVIPAKYFISSRIEPLKLNAINDCINKYLSENPLFVEKVFVKSKKKQLRQNM